MKKILFIIAIAVAAASQGNAQIHYIDVQPDITYPVGVTSSVPSASFAWTLNDAANDILSNDAVIVASITGNVSIIVRATATNGQTAAISVTGSNGSCTGATQNATIRVGLSTFTANFPTATQSICENDNSAAVSVGFTAVGTATATAFVYFIDLDNDGIQDPSELDVLGVIAANAATIPASVSPYNTPSIVTIRIKSVSGIDGVNTVSSPQTAINHVITINAKPVITWF